MKKENRVKNLMRRDEILRNHVTDAGFLAFFMLMLFGSIFIITDLLSNEISLDMAKPELKLMGFGLLVFLYTLFMFTRAKKEYFNQRSVRIVSLVASICVGINLYTEGYVLWVFLLGWGLLSFVIYKSVKFLFEDITKTHPYF